MLIEQARFEAEEFQRPEENNYHALRELTNKHIIKVHTIKRIKNMIMTPFNELLEWLAIAPESLKMQDFATLLYRLFKNVNETKDKIKKDQDLDLIFDDFVERVNKTRKRMKKAEIK